jgi:penicillin-insensitive murein DD-endopeptidase
MKVVTRRALSAVALVVAPFVAAGCGGTPSPLAPSIRGSVGLPQAGVLTDAARLPQKGEGYALLRTNGVQWGNPRLVAAIQEVAAVVSRERDGARLIIGDLSARTGGAASGHRSHRTGRDADLLLFVTTVDGRPVESPGFLRFGPDGLADTHDGAAKDDDGKPNRKVASKDRFLRFDAGREWLLVKALISSRQANVQWLFVARWLEALIIEYARARGEDPELIWYAESVLQQPGDSAPHDDHLHLRIACTPDEAVAGCMGGGPQWPWLPQFPTLMPAPDAELADAIVGDLLRSALGRAPSP